MVKSSGKSFKKDTASGKHASSKKSEEGQSKFTQQKVKRQFVITSTRRKYKKQGFWIR